MKKGLKTTWNDIVRILPPAKNHEGVAAILNARGRQTHFPVTLRNGGTPVLTAHVGLFPAPHPLEGAALAVVDHKLRRHDLWPDWDNALVGGRDTPLNKIDFLYQDDFGRKVGAYLGIPLKEALQLAEKEKDVYRLYHDNKPMPPGMENDLLCAVIIANTATVRSTDMKEMILSRDGRRALFFGSRALEL